MEEFLWLYMFYCGFVWMMLKDVIFYVEMIRFKEFVIFYYILVNCDFEVFDWLDEFIMNRDNIMVYMVFGKGWYWCVGMLLVRLWVVELCIVWSIFRSWLYIGLLRLCLKWFWKWWLSLRWMVFWSFWECLSWVLLVVCCVFC